MSDDKYSENQDMVDSRLDADRPGSEKRIIYSVFDKGDDAYRDINALAHNGKVKFIMSQSDDGRMHESHIVENPTWLDVCVLANDMMGITGDYHHRYLEDIEPVDTANDDDITRMRFVMGS